MKCEYCGGAISTQSRERVSAGGAVVLAGVCSNCSGQSVGAPQSEVALYVTGSNPRPASRARKIGARLERDGLRVAVIEAGSDFSPEGVIRAITNGYPHVVLPLTRDQVLGPSFMGAINRYWPEARNVHFVVKERS